MEAGARGLTSCLAAKSARYGYPLPLVTLLRNNPRLFCAGAFRS
jgi:hypothetical protein